MAVTNGALPGFGKPVTARTDLPSDKKFPIAILEHEGYEGAVLPVREYAIMSLVEDITNKPNWHLKVFDDVIAAKWKHEMIHGEQSVVYTNHGGGSQAQNEEAGISSEDVSDDDLQDDASDTRSAQWSANSRGEIDVSQKMADWVINEVKYKANLLNQDNCIEALDGVWKSDTVVSSELKVALQEAVKSLEDVPEKDKDWHPGSDGQVLDLVHPSIYPFVYGQSPILPNEKCGVENCVSLISKGQTLEAPSNADEMGPEWSTKYQWLPSEFDAPPFSDEVTTQSYINNVHPKEHPKLYILIPKFVSRAIPLWNRVLSRVTFGDIPPRVSDWSNSHQGYDKSEDDEPEQDDGEDDDAYYDRLEDWKDAREIVEPEPTEFKTPKERLRDRTEPWTGAPSPDTRDPPDLAPTVDLRKDFGRLQIIVKLASIHLTPEKPAYKGGSWHVEGQANESICATALYYYSSENISPSYLSFRQQVDDGTELPYPQNEHRAIQQIYGFENEDPTIQNLGATLTCEGRLLCFPNVMQHQVSSFKLADPSKPGHRKILALFLVDPHLKIISTENVPPQQHAWWKELVESAGVFDKLPPELVEQVVDSSDFPISLAKAKEQREELMQERKEFVKQNNKDFVRRNTFNLCEH